MATPLSYENVELACSVLTQQGQVPSLRTIRKVIGSGSYSTLSQHLNRWKAEKDGVPFEVQPPAPLIRFWNEMLRDAAKASETKLQEAEKTIEFLTSELVKLEAELEKRGSHPQGPNYPQVIEGTNLAIRDLPNGEIQVLRVTSGRHASGFKTSLVPDLRYAGQALWAATHNIAILSTPKGNLLRWEDQPFHPDPVTLQANSREVLAKAVQNWRGYEKVARHLFGPSRRDTLDKLHEQIRQAARLSGEGIENTNVVRLTEAVTDALNLALQAGIRGPELIKVMFEREEYLLNVLNNEFRVHQGTTHWPDGIAHILP